MKPDEKLDERKPKSEPQSMAGKSLIRCLLDAGYPKEDLEHHGMDLYVYDTPLTREVLRQYCREHHWYYLASALNQKHFHEFVMNTFINQLNKRPMIECAFQWVPESELLENGKEETT